MTYNTQFQATFMVWLQSQRFFESCEYEQELSDKITAYFTIAFRVSAKQTKVVCMALRDEEPKDIPLSPTYMQHVPADKRMLVVSYNGRPIVKSQSQEIVQFFNSGITQYTGFLSDWEAAKGQVKEQGVGQWGVGEGKGGGKKEGTIR